MASASSIVRDRDRPCGRPAAHFKIVRNHAGPPFFQLDFRAAGRLFLIGFRPQINGDEVGRKNNPASKRSP